MFCFILFRAQDSCRFTSFLEWNWQATSTRTFYHLNAHCVSCTSLQNVLCNSCQRSIVCSSFSKRLTCCRWLHFWFASAKVRSFYIPTKCFMKFFWRNFWGFCVKRWYTRSYALESFLKFFREDGGKCGKLGKTKNFCWNGRKGIGGIFAFYAVEHILRERRW